MSSPDSIFALNDIASAWGYDITTPADETQTPEGFVYPALNLSESEFRLLYLHPGRFDDEIEAELVTWHLPALPLTLRDELPFTLLDEVLQALSTAVDQRSQIEFRRMCKT